MLRVGGKSFAINPNNVIYIPSQVPHSIRPKVPYQPLMYLEYGVRDPVDSDDIRVESLTGEEGDRFNVIIDAWASKDVVPEHNGTCWSWPTIRRESMKYLLFATMMSVPDILGYHRHNTEAIYYIDSGRGYVTVGGEEISARPGDSIYIPNGVPHMCRTALAEQPLNVFCVGVAIPHDSQVWVEEDLPNRTI